MKTKSLTFLTCVVCCGIALTAIQITALGQTLVNRYSFTTDASDSVGGRHGTIMGGAAIENGQVVLDSMGMDSSNPDGNYVDLPDGLLAGYNSVTLEAWLTPTLLDMWSRIWDFGNGTTTYTFLSTGNNSQTGPESESVAPGRPSNFLRSRALMIDNTENHVVLTINGPNRLAKLYLNGEVVDVNPNFTNTPAALGSTTNNWLGRSQWGGDDYLVCLFNEFRVYNGPLDALRVKANLAAGPDTVVGPPTVTSIELRVRYPFYVGFPYPVELLATATGFAEPVNICDSPAVTYSVEDPTVLQINEVGVVTGLAPGTTRIIAQYGSLAATQTVEVVNQPYVLRHRYSFTVDASDPEGGQHGILMGNAQIIGGQVVMDGSAGTYVDLPPYLLAPTNVPHNAVTFEGWITPYPVNGAWTRLFDFGHTVGGVGGKDFFLAPNTEANGGSCNLAVSDSTPGWRSEDEVFIPNILGRTNVHLVAIYNPNPNRAILALYLDGILAAQTVTRKPLATLNNVVSYLGRSTYPVDAYLNGAISEFRIWSGEMAPLHIAINGAVGPDVIGPSDPGALQRVRLVLTTNMVRGGVQNATVYADFALVTNVNVTRGLGTIYQSSNPLVVTVNTNGVVTAVGVGSVTITATYGGMSDSNVVTVAAPPLALKNRWSFNETSGTTATDSVGGKHGTLMGNAYFSGAGEVILDGSSGTYVELPPAIVTNYNQVTFETWVTVSSVTPNNTAARLFVFGGAHNTDELGLVARTGGNNTFLRAFLLPTATVPALRGGTIANNKKVHVVGIFNDAAGRVDLYIDGAWENSGFATFSLSALSNAFSRLGANIPLDQFTICNFDEFRIYEGALTPYQIAINKAAGPGTPVIDAGVPVSLSLDVDTVMIQGMRRLAHATANYATVANARLRSDMEEVVLTSSNPSVVRVATGGWLEAVAPGTAYITANVRGCTDTKPVVVVEKQTALLHRYSFTSDGSDSVGKQHAALCGNAVISDGKVALVGNDGTYKANSYVELPPGMVSSLDAVTFEMWVDLGTQGSWARVFDFGNYTSGSAQNGLSYIFLTRPWAATPTRLCFSDGVSAPAEVVLDAGTLSLEGFSGQVVAVLDGVNNQMAIYANGALVASGPMANKRLSGLRDVKCWIGRSLYAADAGLNGSIDEFRIYYGALSAADIAANYAAGPNTVRPALLAVVRPPLSISVVGSQAVISWPVWAGDFTLVSSPVLPATTWTSVSGTPITNGTEIRMTVPITGTQQYFRLRK